VAGGRELVEWKIWRIWAVSPLAVADAAGRPREARGLHAGVEKLEGARRGGGNLLELWFNH